MYIVKNEMKQHEREKNLNHTFNYIFLLCTKGKCHSNINCLQDGNKHDLMHKIQWGTEHPNAGNI